MASQPWLPLLVIFRSGPLVIRPLLAHQGDAGKMQRNSINKLGKRKSQEKERKIFDSPVRKVETRIVSSLEPNGPASSCIT